MSKLLNLSILDYPKLEIDLMTENIEQCQAQTQEEELIQKTIPKINESGYLEIDLKPLKNMPINEDNKTYEARGLLVNLFVDLGYKVFQEIPIPLKNPFETDPVKKLEVFTYQADMIITNKEKTKKFVLEIDGKTGHSTEGEIKKDRKRDKLVYHVYGVKTVRLKRNDILKNRNDLEFLISEVKYQLKNFRKKHKIK